MVLTLSTLRKPVNRQVIDPSTGIIREEWDLYFTQFTSQLNSAVGELGTSSAPTGAQYLVGAADAGLSAERVVTDTTSVTWNLATAGQAKAERAALTGDVTAAANANATTIANDAVTYAKMQNVSATSRILGRKTAAAGDTEECTLSEVLDFIGSAAQGDILYRGASSWARLGAGTNLQKLQTPGAGGNPSWAFAGQELLATGSAAAAATIDIVLTSYTGFRSLMIALTDIVPATDDTQLFMRTSTNGGSSYDAGGTDYVYANFTLTSGEAQPTDGSGGAAQIGISTNDANAKLSSDAGASACYLVHLPSRLSASNKCLVQWSGGHVGTTTAAMTAIGTAFRNTAADVDAVRFLLLNGVGAAVNLTAVNYAVYGWA